MTWCISIEKKDDISITFVLFFFYFFLVLFLNMHFVRGTLNTMQVQYIIISKVRPSGYTTQIFSPSHNKHMHAAFTAPHIHYNSLEYNVWQTSIIKKTILCTWGLCMHIRYLHIPTYLPTYKNCCTLWTV